MKKVLIIHGHPGKDNFTKALADAYHRGAAASGAAIQEIFLSDLDFSYDMPKGYNEIPELEPCLLEAQHKIKAAEHVVFVYPNWWGFFPAKLKAFLDRILLPGFAFKFGGNRRVCCDRLLEGKTARLIVTMDTKPSYYRSHFRQPGHNAMKRAILGFCGFKPVKVFSVGKVKGASESQRKRWIDKAEKLGRRLD